MLPDFNKYTDNFLFKSSILIFLLFLERTSDKLSIAEKEDVLTPVLWNSFHRITLVNKIENERLNPNRFKDFDLSEILET